MSIAVEPEATRLSIAVGGREITFETGVVAKQAHGAVLVRQEGTVVLATAVARTIVSPERTSTAPSACFASFPVSNVISLPPTVTGTVEKRSVAIAICSSTLLRGRWRFE